MAAPRPGNTDRGWNDPPIFDYGAAAQSQSSPRRTALNKRVAYPLATPPQGAPSAETGAAPPISPSMTANILNPAEGPPKLGSVQLLPPATSTSTPTPVPIFVPTLIPTPEPGSQLSPGLVTHPGVAKPALESKENLEELLQRLGIQTEDELLQCIQETLTGLREKCNEELKGRAAEDVSRRVTMIQELWKGGKISAPVRLRLGQLVAALKDDNIDLANSIHLSLMVDHTNEVNQWMVGVKRLIQELYNLKNRKTQEDQPQTESQSSGQSSEGQIPTETSAEKEES